MRRAGGTIALLFATSCSCSGGAALLGAADGAVEEPPCLTSAQCLFGEVCLGGSCGAPTPSPARVGCTRDDDCPDLREACARTTGECVRVAHRCLSDEDCAAGTICDVPHLTCVPGPSPAPGPCEAGASRPCGFSKVGECRYGTQACAGGSWTACSGALWPQRERCDERDDDCDGAVDEDYDLASDPEHCGGCGQVCRFAHAAPLCVGGACARGPCEPGWHDLNGDPADGCEYGCLPANGGVERCDGRDDDCDGLTDEELGTTSCGAGACARTVENCLAAAVQLCVPGLPAAEECNGRDDDCDGTTDEPFDVDFDGWATCAGDCDDRDGAVHPGAPERCNGRDDDCDGVPDPGFDADGDCFTECGTAPGCLSAACAAGYGACVPGVALAMADCNDFNPAVHPLAAERCGPAGTGNGLDDDCDGYVDEGCGPCTDGDGDGWTTCAGDCDDRDRATYPGAPELCDGKDNDCNLLTTENCGVGEPCRWPSGADVCKPRLACARNLATGQWACGSFCNASPLGLGLGDGCAEGESCQFKVVASANEHLCGVPASPPGTRLAGEPCLADSECRSSSCHCPRLGAAGCEVPRYCTDYCGADGYCPAGTACTIVESAVNEASVYTARCLRPAGTAEAGESCAGDAAACRSGALACVGGTCAAPCCSTRSCGDDQHCSLRGAAIAYGTFPDSGRVSVATVPVCLANAGANLGRGAGAACLADADCRSEFCEREATGGTCIELCCHDSDCGGGGATCEVARVRRPDGREHWARACLRLPVPGTLVQQ